MDEILYVQSFMLFDENKLAQKKIEDYGPTGGKPSKDIVLPESNDREDDLSTNTAEFTEGSSSTSNMKRQHGLQQHKPQSPGL